MKGFMLDGEGFYVSAGSVVKPWLMVYSYRREACVGAGILTDNPPHAKLDPDNFIGSPPQVNNSTQGG
jgi:hypothetical protein